MQTPRLTPIIFATALILGACQAPLSAPTPMNPPPALNALRQNNTPLQALIPPLPLSRQFRQELQQKQVPLDDVQPQYVDEQRVEQILGIQYKKSHSYYFQTPDPGLNNKPTVQAILENDGHDQAAQWVKHWESVLGEAAVWPDAQSTTYRGPWPALEHAELRGGDGWFMFRSASAKADEYYQRALQAWKPGLSPDHPEQQAAWQWLGRSAHFIHDVTVPFHTVSLMRPAQLLHHSRYEVTCDETFERYLPSQNHNPAGVWENSPYPAGETWGIYFPPKTSAGAIVKYTADQSREFYGLVNEAESGQNWEKSRAVMIPMGAKLTVGLLLQFLQDVQA